MVFRTDFEEFEEELPHKFYQCRLVFFLFHWTPLQGGAYWCRGSCKVGGKTPMAACCNMAFGIEFS